MADTLFLILYWTGPIGIGIFLVCLGGMLYLLTKADEISKRTKAMGKGLEKKKEQAPLAKAYCQIQSKGAPYSIWQ